MRGLLAIFALAIACDGLSDALHLAVPGSIIGLAGLTAWFAFSGGVGPAIEEAAGPLVRGLALFLVPVGVAVIGLVGRLDGQLLVLVGVSVAALLMGVLFTLGIALAAQRMLDRGRAADHGRPDGERSSDGDRRLALGTR